MSFSQHWKGWSGGARGQELGDTDKSFNRKVNPDRVGLSLDEGVRVNKAEGEGREVGTFQGWLVPVQWY